MEYSLSLQMSSEDEKKQQQQQLRTPQYSHPSLHGVRKPPAKPWRRPDLPPAPKVYRVDPRGFRRLVQSLTGMPQSAAPRPASAAPPPIKLDQKRPRPLPLLPSTMQQQPDQTNSLGTSDQNQMMGLLSPSFYSSCCSFPLLSPGSMASLES